MLELNKIYNMDCLEGMKQMPDNSVDLIIIDPPYGIDYHSKHGSKEYKTRVQTAHEWDAEFDFSLYFEELFRLLNNNSFMYVFGCFNNFETMMRLGVNRILIWDKNNNGMGDLNDWGIGYELIFVFKKGKPLLRGNRINGCIRCQHIGYFDKTLHPTQKPTSIIKILIEKSSNKKDIVLDCFMGCGTTAVACKQLGRNFIGFELSHEYCKIAEERLNQKTLTGGLNDYSE